MKKIIAALLFASASAQVLATPITSASDPALAGATVEGFVTSSGTNDFATSYTFGNATISVATGQLHLSSDSNGEFSITGNSILNPQQQPIQIDFALPVSAFGLLRVYAQDSAWLMVAKDSNGAVIESLTLPVQSDPTNPESFDGIAGGLISQVLLTPATADAMLIDNLTYVLAAPVPEPAMLGLFGLGAIGIGLARRRKA